MICTPLLEILEDSNETMRQAFTWVCIPLLILLNNRAMVHIVIGCMFLVIN